MLWAQLFPRLTVSSNLLHSCIAGLLVFAGLASISGCQTAQVMKQVGTENPGGIKPAYDALVLNYETTDLRRLFSRIKNRSVASGLATRFSRDEKSAEEEPLEKTGPESKWCQARIQIVYPHPDGSEDKGLARLIVSRDCQLKAATPSVTTRLKDGLSRIILRASGTSEELVQLASSSKKEQQLMDEEIWHLSLPKEELDILLSELSQRGFFNKQERPRGEARVSIVVDQGEVSKRWTSEPRLEDLMQQIYDEGELSAFNTQGAKIHSVSSSRPKASPLKG